VRVAWVIGDRVPVGQAGKGGNWQARTGKNGGPVFTQKVEKVLDYSGARP
jgi:hypothetical protein